MMIIVESGEDTDVVRSLQFAALFFLTEGVSDIMRLPFG